jgi:hypothetical protein
MAELCFGSLEKAAPVTSPDDIDHEFSPQHRAVIVANPNSYLMVRIVLS